MIRVCSACGAKNRVPPKHLAATGRCGVCKAELPPSAEPIEVDTTQFDQIVAEAPVPVLVDFWAPWCGPCRISAPEVRELAREMAGKALVLKVNSDENPVLASRFGIQAIPYFVVLREGRVLAQQAGVMPRAAMRRLLEAAWV